MDGLQYISNPRKVRRGGGTAIIANTRVYNIEKLSIFPPSPLEVVWGLAKTSGRPLPFMIDTPLARLDDEHRESLVEKFYPYASHQLIIFSTNSEINKEFYPKLEPHIERSFVLQYDSEKGKSVKHDNYFFNQSGEKIIEV